MYFYPNSDRMLFWFFEQIILSIIMKDTIKVTNQLKKKTKDIFKRKAIAQGDTSQIRQSRRNLQSRTKSLLPNPNRWIQFNERVLDCVWLNVVEAVEMLQH